MTNFVLDHNLLFFSGLLIVLALSLFIGVLLRRRTTQGASAPPLGVLAWFNQNTLAIIITMVFVSFAIWAAWLLVDPLVDGAHAMRWYQAQVNADDIKQRAIEIPNEISELHMSWLSEAIFWRHLHYVLTIASIALSAIVASGTAILGDKPRNIAAVLAAISTAMLATLSPYKTYEDFIGAWRSVNVAKIEYLTGKGNIAEFVSNIRTAEDNLREARHLPDKASK